MINLPNKPQLLATNFKSAFAFPEVIDAKISKEIKLGRSIGPSSVPLMFIILGFHHWE